MYINKEHAMSEQNIISADEMINEGPDLQQMIEPDTEIKNWLVEYVGEKTQPENDEVTLEMVIEAVAEEFPEFLLPIAEENFIRGYRQALEDVDEGQRLAAKEAKTNA